MSHSLFQAISFSFLVDGLVAGPARLRGGSGAVSSFGEHVVEWYSCDFSESREGDNGWCGFPVAVVPDGGSCEVEECCSELFVRAGAGELSGFVENLWFKSNHVASCA